MKLKNNALQELYDTLANGTISISPYAESPVAKAFKECDDVLKILQDRIDILEKSYNAVLSANLDLVTRKGQLENEFRKMKEHVLEDHKIIANINSERAALEKERDDLLGRTHCAEDEVEELKIELHTAEEARDNIRAELEAKVKRMDEITKELVDTKIQLKFSKASNDDWQRRANNAGKQIDELKATLEKANADRTELQKDRDSYHELYTELSKTYDKLSEDNEKLKTRTDCLRVEVEWYRKHYRDQSDKIQNLNKKLEYLTSQYQKLTIENKRVQDNVRKNCYDQGQTDLWVKLQDVKDVQPEDFDVECETLGDVIDMDLEDFLDAYKKWYKKWQEEKETDRMRKWLTDFCDGRRCKECPLESSEYKCGMGYTFMGVNPIPDKDIKRYYEKARGCGRYTLKDDPCSGVREKIKDACDAFYDGIKAGLASEVKEVPVSCNIPIKDPTSWECTIEATVEVNKDLLEKVCGVKLEKEAHKLEYGDAVRLPWRDYDYMYIGPDNEEETVVRMFDPKNHAIATSHIGNVKYSGCKIIICDEDDLRKIWKDKK